MRLYNRFFLLAIIATFYSSCEKALEVEAENTISGDVLTSTEAIEDALVGAYYSFTGISDGSMGGELLGGDFQLFSTLLSRVISLEIFFKADDAPAYRSFLQKDIQATNERVQANWQRAYEVINTANLIIANIDHVTSDTDKNRILGEALAMRGILYFEMVRLWAPQYGTVPDNTPAIPVLLEPVTEVDRIVTPTLSSIGAVYDQAEEDLAAAAALLETFGKNDWRLSYYACQAYLARLSLQKGEYAAARDYASNVIQGPYSLMDSLQAFNNPSNSSEDIFAVQQTLANNTGDKGSGFGITAFYSSLTESGLGTLSALEFSLNSPFHFNSPRFSANDLRGTIDESVSDMTTSEQIRTAFYSNVTSSSNLSIAKYTSTKNVLPVIRLAEMHLTRAEAIFKTDSTTIDPVALSDLNLIRSRANLNVLLQSNFESPRAFYDSLVLERKRELLFEGHLLHDLRRWNKPIGGTFYEIESRDSRLRLPIPQSETDTWED